MANLRLPFSLFIEAEGFPSGYPRFLDARTNMSIIQPASPEHFGPAVAPVYPKPVHSSAGGPVYKAAHDTTSISADAHRQYQGVGRPTHAPQLVAAKRTPPVRGSSEIHHQPELNHKEPEKPRAPEKPTHSFHKALKVAGLGARHIGGLTGGYIGKFVGKQIGGLITDLTGSKSLGSAAGTIAGTASGAFAGSLVGAAIPNFCPYGGALFAGVSGAFEAFKADKH